MRQPRSRSILLAIAPLAVTLGLLAPVSAQAATTLTPATASQYNTTPDCPVSASNIVCAWNLAQDAGNAFTAGDYGQCPYWAAEKYPALVSDESSSDPLGEDWDGSTWAEHAEQEGLTVSTTPASGDLAVWQATADDPAGHVAYVEAIDGDAIIVSQMDGDSSAPFPALQGSTEYISAANISYFEQTYGLEFIQTGQPSSTPLSYLEAPVPVTVTPTPAETTTGVTSTTATTVAGATTPRDRTHAATKPVRRVKRSSRSRALARADARRLARAHRHERTRHHAHATRHHRR